MGDLTINGEHIPFDVFGLDHDALTPMTIAAVGHHGDVINLVALGHGDRSTRSHQWVQVAVVGPLQGVLEHGRWTMDPTPMIATELLNAAGVAIATGDELQQQIDAVIARDSSSTQLTVDGNPEQFEFTREGDHWAAMRHVKPDHLLYVVASNLPHEQVRLRRLGDLHRYTRATAHA